MGTEIQLYGEKKIIFQKKYFAAAKQVKAEYWSRRKGAQAGHTGPSAPAALSGTTAFVKQKPQFMRTLSSSKLVTSPAVNTGK